MQIICVDCGISQGYYTTDFPEECSWNITIGAVAGAYSSIIAMYVEDINLIHPEDSITISTGTEELFLNGSDYGTYLSLSTH